MVIGAAPAIFYAFTNRFANLVAFNHHRFVPSTLLRLGTLRILITQSIPPVVGWQFPYSLLSPQQALISLLEGVAIGVTIAALVYTCVRILAPQQASSPAHTVMEYLRPFAASTSQRWNDGFPLILIAVIMLVYWRSSATNVSAYLAVDFARYALPLTTALTLMCARLFGDLDELPVLASRVWRPGESPSRPAPSRPRPRPRMVAGTVFLALTLITYLIPYALTNMVSAIQSPYDLGGVFPSQDVAMIAYLEDHHILDVWVDHWTGNVIVYLSNQQVNCADYIDAEVQRSTQRFADVYVRVQAANVTSFIITSKPSDGKPITERALDALGVIYISARFGNFVVITPTSRMVRPQEIVAALQKNYYPSA